MEVGDVMTEVEKDRDYYQDSGGGMTLSGGEPLAQFDFTLALMKSAREQSIHTCLETSGQVPADRLLKVAPFVDLFLFDWKESDLENHKRFTGADNSLIWKNLTALDRVGASIILRCPLVPGLNDRPDHLGGIIELAGELSNLRDIEIMPYHPMGQSKNERLGRSNLMPETDFCDPETVKNWRASLPSC